MKAYYRIGFFLACAGAVLAQASPPACAVLTARAASSGADIARIQSALNLCATGAGGVLKARWQPLPLSNRAADSAARGDAIHRPGRDAGGIAQSARLRPRARQLRRRAHRQSRAMQTIDLRLPGGVQRRHGAGLHRWAGGCVEGLACRRGGAGPGIQLRVAELPDPRHHAAQRPGGACRHLQNHHTECCRSQDRFRRPARACCSATRPAAWW